MAFQDHYNGGANWRRTREQQIDPALKAKYRQNRVILNRAQEPPASGRWIPINSDLLAYFGQATDEQGE